MNATQSARERMSHTDEQAKLLGLIEALHEACPGKDMRQCDKCGKVSDWAHVESRTTYPGGRDELCEVLYTCPDCQHEGDEDWYEKLMPTESDHVSRALLQMAAAQQRISLGLGTAEQVADDIITDAFEQEAQAQHIEDEDLHVTE